MEHELHDILVVLPNDVFHHMIDRLFAPMPNTISKLLNPSGEPKKEYEGANTPMSIKLSVGLYATIMKHLPYVNLIGGREKGTVKNLTFEIVKIEKEQMILTFMPLQWSFEVDKDGTYIFKDA